MNRESERLAKKYTLVTIVGIGSCKWQWVRRAQVKHMNKEYYDKWLKRQRAKLETKITTNTTLARCSDKRWILDV